VGVDTENLTIGVRAALRQDPDVVVLGEIADVDTIDTAIKGAETGRLVIASMPTPDVVTTIERILTTLPREEREIGRMRLSEALRAIVSQQLLPLKDDKGRVAAVEVLITTPAVRECLKDAKRTGELRRHMADGRKQIGTQTFVQPEDDQVEDRRNNQETAKPAHTLRADDAPVPAKKGSRQAASA
jgi:twitching motility protein PilT